MGNWNAMEMAFYGSNSARVCFLFVCAFLRFNTISVGGFASEIFVCTFLCYL